MHFKHRWANVVPSGSDIEVLRTAADWLEDGRDVALVTVARTWGASPRPVGSLMAMDREGRWEGSVSGGCVEADLLARYRDGELAGPLPTLVDYGTDPGRAERLGLPCGGRLELVVEVLESAAPLNALLEMVGRGKQVLRRVCLNTGEVSLHPAGDDSAFRYEQGNLWKIFGSSWTMLLVGAEQVTRHVARMALELEYRVTVCEPRPDRRAGWSEPNVEVFSGMPDDAVRAMAAPPGRSVVITLAHDPRLDDMALMEALCLPLFYVGALGSRRTSAARRERLGQLGISPSQLDRLHAPVGLAIGSRTPAEIALSVMAEITALRNGAISGSGGPG